MRTRDMARVSRAGRTALVVMAIAACNPGFDETTGLVGDTRILAVRAEPPEAKPGAAVTWTALVARPDGTPGDDGLRWRFCTTPKGPAENNVVASECMEDANLSQSSWGNPTAAQLPLDACSRFGPDTPPGGFRPRSPDATGGYYQPLRIDASGSDVTFQLHRILCHLAQAPFELAAQYSAKYVPNQNPRLLPAVFRIGGSDASIETIPSGVHVHIEASWSPSDAEAYEWFDQGAQALVTRREVMRVAWFASQGEFEAESTGRDENDPESTTENVWTAPNVPGPVHFWVVLRDSRGGSDFAAYDGSVVP